MPESIPLPMDRAYEGNETRQLVLDLGRSSASSADSKVSAASFRDLKSSMFSFGHFCRSRSSSRHFD
jgi:hypothetical protein